MNRARAIVFVIIFAPLGALAVLLAVSSLHWRMAHDLPVVLYISYLIDRQGLIPYRDIWDINLPGTYFVYMLIGRLFNYNNDQGLRLFDLAYLIAVLSLALNWLRPLGWKVMWAAAVSFMLFYIGGGPTLALQREYLALLPITGAVIVAASMPHLPERVRAGLVGVLMGLTSTIKPQLAIGLPVILFFGYLEWRDRRREWEHGFRHATTLLLIAIGGFTAPLIAMFIYMVASGALPHYLEIVRGYYPLYAQVTQNLTIVSDPDKRLNYLITTYSRFGRLTAWFVPAVATMTVAAMRHTLTTRAKRQIALACALAIVYSIYPLFSGQFFNYHWIPFAFFLIVTAAMSVASFPAMGTRLSWVTLATLALAILLQAGMWLDLKDRVSTFLDTGSVPQDDTADRADDMAARLAEYVRPGDTVQPLDWVDGGVLHALLINQARIATPYIADMVFYQDTSSPYLMGLRDDLLRRLDANPPRFVLDFQYVTWIRGPHSASDFPELRVWLADRYTTLETGNTYELDELARPAEAGTIRAVVVISPGQLTLTQWNALFPDRPATVINAEGTLEEPELSTILTQAIQGADMVTLIFMGETPVDFRLKIERLAIEKLQCDPERPGAGAIVVDCSAWPSQ